MPRTVPAGLAASEQGPSRNFLRLFLVTLADVSGAVMRFVEGDKSFSVDVGDGNGVQRWDAARGIGRGTAEQQAELKVDALSVTIPNQPFAIPTLGTNDLVRWATLGVFENATVQFWVYDLASGTAALWSVWVIQGLPRWTYSEVTFQLESQWGTADRHVPRTIIGDPCNNKLGDAFCTVNLALFTSLGLVAPSPAPTRTQFSFTVNQFGQNVPMPIPDHRLELGTVAFLTGAVSPLRRMVFRQVGNAIQLATALPFAPAPGDQISLVYGCDKTGATCQSVFNNLANHRATPYVPKADTVYDI